MSERNEAATPAPASHDGGPLLEVFWRPGCPYCSGLRRQLDRRRVPAVWRNIWDDEQARAFVASANAGNETVPTVRIGQVTLTNPTWRQIATVLPEAPWSHEQPQPKLTRARWRGLSWLPVVLAVAASVALDALGYSAASWAADAVAVAGWWFTRQMRR